ncbi:segregation and condensation protein A, partial [Curtobacterium sp. AB451]|uniref:segregation and condensation protein A n=1 Tax=Curtobacterium sp. AB451 TaxID=3422306 RepID=UPI003D338EA0
MAPSPDADPAEASARPDRVADPVESSARPDRVADPAEASARPDRVADTQSAPAGTQTAPGFRVRLAGFDGPFDLLLSLITKHELDITEVSLGAVTGEFIAYVRQAESQDELDEASEFLVVAATLLDLKIAGLLPQGELVDAEDVALLEARDLLFARLLQYRAFKQAADWFGSRWLTESRRHARSVRLEERFRARTPELVWTLSVQDFAALATLAFAPRELPTVGLDHLHAPLVSIREQAAIVVSILRTRADEDVSFRELVAGVA